jgi:hypothetical protein
MALPGAKWGDNRRSFGGPQGKKEKDSEKFLQHGKYFYDIDIIQFYVIFLWESLNLVEYIHRLFASCGIESKIDSALPFSLDHLSATVSTIQLLS